MSRNKNKKKILIPVICIVVIIGVLCGVFVPRFLTQNVIQQNLCQGEQQSYRFSDDYKPFVEFNEGTFFVNEKNAAVAITDKKGKVVFNSHSDDAAQNKLACLLSLTLRDKAGNSYIKNSTKNSVDFDAFEIKSEKENSVTITFSFVEGKKQSASEIIPVSFSEEKGGLKVEIDTTKVVLKDGFCIEKISLLPGLFSENNPDEQCFYTIPDGCGAQIDLTAPAQEAYSQTLDVYGSDITFNDYSQGATLPCFSITKNGVMLTAVISDGDGISSIYVKHNENVGGSLYNTFVVTPYGKVQGKLVKGATYNGIISQVFYLSAEGKRNYNTVSDIVRDFLTNKGYLPNSMSDKFVDFPFFVTVIGTADGKRDNIYTTFENATEIVALLKSRGVRCTALRFAGAGAKGLNSRAGSSKINNDLGGSKGYNKLCSVANDKNSSVWLDVNFSVSPSQNSKNSFDLYSDLRAYLSKESVKSRVGSYMYANSNISKVYKQVLENEFGNVCINDLSYLLYTDAIGGVDRQTALNSLRDKTQSLSVSGGLMLTSPAVYLMNQADAVFSVTQRASLEGNTGVTRVPLLQMVLHGSVCYGSEPVNLFEDCEEAVLRAVEYGASPSFIFTYDKCNVLDYGVYATRTAKFYSSVKRMLPLMDMKMTSHELVVSGVYKVTYDFNKVVYINYNPSVVEVNGILISARDFVII